MVVEADGDTARCGDRGGHGGDFPDFLTPVAGQDGLAAGLDAITHMPAARLAGDLDFVARSRSLPVWARDLATASPSALTELNGALRAYHDTYLAPFWPTIQAHVDADRATTGGERRLSALIGRTRAEVLTVLADMHTTGEIARRFGLSPPTVSLHTTTGCS